MSRCCGHRNGGLCGAQTAWAVDTPNCIQDVWQAHGNSQSLTCTAKDVTLSAVTNICITHIDGVPVANPDANGCQQPNPQGQLTCSANKPFTFTADYSMPLTAQDRFDLGLYIASDGGGTDGALTGLCFDNVLTANNSDTFDNNDPSPDTCGDIENKETQTFSQSITATCSDTDATAGVDLPFCVSWRQPGANEVCDSTTPSPPTLPVISTLSQGRHRNVTVAPSISLSLVRQPALRLLKQM